jgi:hypothetical protein
MTTQIYSNARAARPQSHKSGQVGGLPTKPPISSPLPSTAPEIPPIHSLAELLETDDVLKLMACLETKSPHNTKCQDASDTMQNCKVAMLDAYNRLKAAVTTQTIVVSPDENNRDKYNDANKFPLLVRPRHLDSAQTLDLAYGESKPIINYQRKPILVHVNPKVSVGEMSKSGIPPATICLLEQNSTAREIVSPHVQHNDQLLLSAVERAANKLILDEEQEVAYNTSRQNQSRTTTPKHSSTVGASFSQERLHNEAKPKSDNCAFYELCPNVDFDSLHLESKEDSTVRKPLAERESYVSFKDTTKLGKHMDACPDPGDASSLTQLLLSMIQHRNKELTLIINMIRKWRDTSTKNALESSQTSQTYLSRRWNHIFSRRSHIRLA